MATSNPSPQIAKASLPAWARELMDQYASNASSQFIVYGNVNDRMLLPGSPMRLGGLRDFLLEVLMPRFTVVLSYDIGNGIRIEKGGDVFSQWPYLKENAQLPKVPLPAIETLTRYFRYCANLGRLGRESIQVGCIINNADLLAPALQGTLAYDLNALASLTREWANDSLLISHSLATFLLVENINDLHPLIVNNPRAAQVKIALPTPEEMGSAFSVIAPSYPTALKTYSNSLDLLAAQLSGATLGTIESTLKTKEYRKETIVSDDVVKLKKQLVERDCNGLIEFVESKRTLNDMSGLEKIKSWLRQDIELWRKNDVQALPKGYLFCGPVGTGKTFLVECLAGEAGVPVVKMKNFRDKWVGSSEGNLEKIFRLIKALGRCYVFIDEADQALGRRDANSGDSGVSGRLYSMIAEEMGSSSSRGKVIWVLASSRPDLIEVDLKRPGRVDIKVPIFPTMTARESFDLVQTLAKRCNVTINDADFEQLESHMPTLLTPGAAEAIASKIYRRVRTAGESPVAALQNCLCDYQNPVPHAIMDLQIRLAVQEASDLDFVPTEFRRFAAE
jgi:SpoVK/Ycf46/Vps4 family AAA+-type ATPase